MITLYYEILFVVSVLLTVVYVLLWHKHFDVHLTLVFTVIPIANLGYVMLAHSESLEAAILSCKVTYLGGCFLLLFILLIIVRLCHIEIGKGLNVALIAFSMLVYASALTIGYRPIFYKNVSLTKENGASVLVKEYGPMHTVFYLLMIAYVLLSLAALIYGYVKKKDVSNRIIRLLFIPEVISIIFFFGGRMITKVVEMVPLAYIIDQLFYLIIAHRTCLYDITDTGIDSLVETGDTGFVSFDFKFRYLGSNETAKRFFPELYDFKVDMPIVQGTPFENSVLEWLNGFKADDTNDKIHYERNGRIYLVDINYLYDGKHKRGYQFFLTDDTSDQQYISLLNQYNSKLQDEVAEKTAHIVEMHDRLILGMATMVESRDNSTGGHIRRTSDVVRMLIEEIKKDNRLRLDDEFCKDLIKAAPMHDLGKIAVDDAILRKPGRFTDEEYEKMKAHAKEGARIVHSILEGTDDSRFHLIAENVAHYHHERWDGSGYPEGLKGEDIPLEARIMAIADVYDALVSKRVYKERMSFEQADAIIMEGMGRHFDKRLEPYYVSARPKLEAYYSSEN